MSETGLLKKPKFKKTRKESKLQKYERNKVLGEAGAGIGAMIGVAAAARQLAKEDSGKGYKAAEKEGFTHTNKAKDFNDEGETKNEEKK